MKVCPVDQHKCDDLRCSVGICIKTQVPKGEPWFKDGQLGEPPAASMCRECPLALASIPAYLGGYTVDDYLTILHSDADIACHMSPGFHQGELSTQRCCTGVAAYRANVGKLPRGPHAAEAVKLIGKRADVFASPADFAAHHAGAGTREGRAARGSTPKPQPTGDPVYDKIARIVAQSGKDPRSYDEFVELLDARTTRTCDGCDLCCSALEVREPPEIDKAMGERCQHQTEGCAGCAIYDQRPSLCRFFYCSWRFSEALEIGIPAHLRPADVGFVLHWDEIKNPLLMTLFIDAARPTAWARHKKTLETIARKHDIAVVIGGGDTATHIVTPKGRWIARTDFPEFFEDYGADGIGVPAVEYRDPALAQRRAQLSQMRAMA